MQGVSDNEWAKRCERIGNLMGRFRDGDREVPQTIEEDELGDSMDILPMKEKSLPVDGSDDQDDRGDLTPEERTIGHGGKWPD